MLTARRFHPRRYRPGGEGTWSGHLPFANDLIAALRPDLLVELGAHRGESYFGFCQAVEENELDCACYAVDTWKGDSHSGYYGETVFREVNRYNRDRYQTFSSLIRSTFDEANGQFAEASVDLLHIDGLHTYGAVKHDFELWLPKVRPGGVILLHDISVRHADFEVWRLWEELKTTYEHFEFHHSWGLGVVRVPGAGAPEPPLLRGLFTGQPAERRAIREHYAFAADYLDLSWRTSRPAEEPKAFLQIFGDCGGVYTEAASGRAELVLGAWRSYVIELPQGAESGRLRVDPADFPCVVNISSIAVRRADDHLLLFQYTAKADLESCTCNGDLMFLPAADHVRLLSFGTDPQFIVNAPESVSLQQALQVEICMCVLPSLETASAGRGSEERGSQGPVTDGSELDRAVIERTLALNRVETLRAELKHQQTERLVLVSEFRRASSDRETLARDLEMLKTSLAKEQDLRTRLENEAAVLRLQVARYQLEIAQSSHRQTEPPRMAEEPDRDSALAPLRVRFAHAESESQSLGAGARNLQSGDRVAQLERDLAETQQALADERAQRTELLRSYSWKISKPLRQAYSLLKAGKSPKRPA